MTLNWSSILGQDNHKDKLTELLQDIGTSDGLCEHLIVSSTALRSKFKREGIVPKKEPTIRELIVALGDTSNMTTKEIASRIGKQCKSVSSFCVRNKIPRVKLYNWAREKEK